ncbi:hypothetical protein BU23DRAFT_553208 [Bimuria novae-zelandiae CBS 107.79]|uniref:RING-type domain-containing protein n=1 Tax=Bimuria novae-zelandiae CBS 107.79 TaxID=1447943 RepID=A0A6A5VHL3_9PLEO|nr:hypothetical protein BU23DRAFT_553208 [Bimuria novae-zelandiae CBS 107.79]
MLITLADFRNVSNLLEFIKDAEVQHPTEGCPICFEDYPTDPNHILGVNEFHVKLPCCGHEFCVGCLFSVIDKYGGNNFRCPLCRVVKVGDEGVARVLESRNTLLAR